MDHTTYEAVSPSELSNALWKNDIRELPGFNFFFNYTNYLEELKFFSLWTLKNSALCCSTKTTAKVVL